MRWKWYKHKFPSDIPWRGVGVEGVDKLRVFIFCSVIMSSSSIFLWLSQSMSPEDVFLVTTGKLHFTLTIHQMHLKSNPYNGRWLLIKRIEFYRNDIKRNSPCLVLTRLDRRAGCHNCPRRPEQHHVHLKCFSRCSWSFYGEIDELMIPSQSLPLPTRPSSTWPTPWIGAQFIFSSNILSFVFCFIPYQFKSQLTCLSSLQQCEALCSTPSGNLSGSAGPPEFCFAFCPCSYLFC